MCTGWKSRLGVERVPPLLLSRALSPCPVNFVCFTGLWVSFMSGWTEDDQVGRVKEEARPLLACGLPTARRGGDAGVHET
jgi:hypothetical protein